MKVFTSGSCRLVSVINNGYDLVNVIHSWIGYYTSINYLSFYHTTKQHIQFIRYIRKEIEIPENILNNFMIGGNDELDTFRKERTENIRKEFESCDVYIFEICSLKYFTEESFQINKKNKEEYIQDKDDLYNDLDIIRSMFPIEKKIIFQTHIRINQIEKREIINEVVLKYCNNNKEKNVQHFDPTYLIKLNPHILVEDNLHFHEKYNKFIFEHIYKTYII